MPETLSSLSRLLAGRSRLPWRAAAVAGLLAALTGCASLPAASVEKEAQAQRLGDLFVQTLPLDRVVAKIMHDEPKWPFQHASTSQSIAPETLACVRAEMKPEKITAQQRADARRYADANPTRIADEIRLLESGAAHAIGTLIMSGAQEGMTGSPTGTTRRQAINAKMDKMPPEQALAMMQLILNPAYDDLRKAMRINLITESIFDRSGSYRKGVQLGASLMLPPLLSAMQTCNVPLSALN